MSLSSTSSSSEKKPLSPLRTVITSFTPRKRRDHYPSSAVVNSPYEEGDWVLCLATNSGHHFGSNSDNNSRTSSLACALSNGQVQVYDTQRLHLVRSFNHASRAVTDLVYGNNTSSSGNRNALLSAGQEGFVHLYDLRQSEAATAAAARIKLPHQQPALCLSLGYENGHICAIGSSKGRIHFVDLRNPQQILGTYYNAHRDHVTQVHFFEARPTRLLSGSEDGLVCLFDTTKPTEETALSTVINVGAPIRQAGFCNGLGSHGNSNDDYIFCLTGNETLGLWKVNTTTTTMVRQYTREHFLLAATTATATESRQSSSYFWSGMEYLVKAHWDEVQRQLWILAGGTVASSPTSAGNSALFRIQATPATANSNLGINMNNQQPLQLVESMVGGHCGIIRSWCPTIMPTTSTTTGSGDGGGGGGGGCSMTFITAGEDARLCEWQMPNAGGPAATVLQQPQCPPQQPSTQIGTKRRTTGGGGSSSPSNAAANNNNNTSTWRPRQRHKSSQSSSLGMSPY